jgi:SiaC family regulatory phosphoprotein
MKQDLIIEENKGKFYLPKVKFEYDTGFCQIQGECYLIDAEVFFQPLIDWILAYPLQDISFHFKLTYFNTSSSRGILNLLKALKSQKEKGKNVEILWYYPVNNQHLKAEAEDFMDDLHLNFTIVPISN